MVKKVKRRAVLQYLSAGVAGVCLSKALPSLTAAASDHGGKVKWGYVGKTGPENWGKLSPDFKLCQLGEQQSPIDLTESVAARLKTIKVKYQESPLRIVNNGHTIQVNYAPGSRLKLDGQWFELLQFHFHNPSEHEVNGELFPMELHFVHQNEAGALAVLGVLLKPGRSNPALQPIWDAMPAEEGPEQTIPGVEVDAAQLLPGDLSIYRYFGSLTTPPCSEGVNWMVLRESVEMSRAQIEQFAKIIPLSARPVQALNRRFLLRSF